LFPPADAVRKRRRLRPRQEELGAPRGRRWEALPAARVGLARPQPVDRAAARRPAPRRRYRRVQAESWSAKGVLLAAAVRLPRQEAALAPMVVLREQAAGRRKMVAGTAAPRRGTVVRPGMVGRPEGAAHLEQVVVRSRAARRAPAVVQERAVHQARAAVQERVARRSSTPASATQRTRRSPGTGSSE